MNKKNHYINLFVLACMMVLAITSCQQELMPVQPEADSARTLSFTLNMPQGKPAFGEGESRAATNGTWAEGDELLMTLTAGENEDKYMILYLTLQHNASGTWDVLADKSYMRFPKINSSDPYSVNSMLKQETGLSLSGGTWTVRADEAWPENLPMSVQLVYAPDMEFDAEGGLVLKADATTSLPEYWDAASTENTDGTLSLQWTEPAYARLRIYTGMAGDVVKLTSESISAKFTRTDHTYTATTQTDGYACFYCTTTGTSALTSGFLVELTKIVIADMNYVIALTPISLLQATSLVPVALTAGKSYKLDAGDKRQKVVDEFIVIDGDKTKEEMKAAIDEGYAAGKRIIVVTGEELVKYDSYDASTVVGQAIYAANVEGGSLTLLIPEVTSVPDNAFYGCSNLASVSFPSATSIGYDVFDYCNKLASVSFPALKTIPSGFFLQLSSLEEVSFPSAESIGNSAFYGCSQLASVSFPSATSIGEEAFFSCDKLTSASFPSAESIGNSAFYGCSQLASVSFPSATSIGNYSFYGCSNLASVSFPSVTSIGGHAFDYCKKLATLSFGSVIASVVNNTFWYIGDEAGGCDLHLAKEQGPIYGDMANGRWGNYNWKSITVGGVKIYPAANGN